MAHGSAAAGNRVGMIANPLLWSLLLLLLLLTDTQAQDYCVDHYWVPGTGAQGTTEESCQMMQPKDGWCGESASNCEAGCGSVWCAATSTDISPCPPGRYSATAQADSCIDCGAGKYYGSAGAASDLCENCAEGQYSAAGAPACTNCPAGTYTTAPGSAICTNCDACKFYGAEAQISDTCMDCAEGQYSVAGASACITCEAGKYSESSQAACRDCSPGSFTNTLEQPGATSCTACPAGQYSIFPQEPCHLCPIGQYNDAPNKTNCTLCAAGRATDTFAQPGATTCDVLERNCAGKVHCEFVTGPARFLCAFGTPVSPLTRYRNLGNWEFETVGDAYNDENATLVLTTTSGDQMGLARYRLPASLHWPTGVLAVRFEMYVGDGSGADGMCVSLGDQTPAGVAENGVALGVSLCFDEFPNSSFENGVDLFVDRAVVWEERAQCSDRDCHPMTLFDDAQWHSVELTTSADGLGGVTVAFEFDGGVLRGAVHVDEFERVSETWLLFSARTGGSTNNHWVRNVAIGELKSHSGLTVRSFASPTCSAPAGGPTGTAESDTNQLPKLGVAFSPDFLCERPLSSSSSSRMIVHAPPDARAVARVVTREDLARLDGLSHADAAKRIGLRLPCYERVLAAMNDSTTNELAGIPLATLPEEFEYVGCGETQAARDIETCLPPGYKADSPESAYWAAVLANQSCLSISNTTGCAVALERLRAKFSGCAGSAVLDIE